MPGSPPTKVAEPGTRPPPATRSNSPMPETKRFSDRGAPESATKSILRPPVATLFGSASLPAASSTIEFHALQSSHLPDHLRCTAPQAWQTKREVGALAIRPSPPKSRHGRDLGPSSPFGRGKVFRALFL